MAKKKVKPIPKGYNSVHASINAPDAKALLAFMKKAFDGKVRSTMPGPDGKLMHAEVKIGDSVVFVSDAVMEPSRPANNVLYVLSVDKTMAKAVKAGAKVLMPAADQFWGDRWGRVEDPQGNRWGIATHIEDVTPTQIQKRMAAMAKQPPGQ
jgi:PhnB protein